MKRRLMRVAVAMLAFVVAVAGAAPSSGDKLPDIPFKRFNLPNGLTVVVSEDHKAPVVAVAVWYHVGSAREPAGKSGYAHLFEHLMFGGSGHHDGSYFAPFEKAGATAMNGTTANDRTNYFETVPTSALDMALWMESDRMGWLLEGLTKHEVDQQRGVVQNEKRQGENQPYGLRVAENIQANAYPVNHPYHHPTIGSMKDLNAASIGDFKSWFHHYYGAANATLVLVGDITPAEAKAKALKYFGEIPSGPPVAGLRPWIFARDRSTTGRMPMDVPQTRIYREWNTPQAGTHADNMLSLAANVLGSGKSSRLYQRLVYQDGLAEDESVRDSSGELGSQFKLQVNAKKGTDPKKIEAAIADVWAAFFENGPTKKELQRAKTDFRAGMVRRIEKVGGFAGKARLLAAGQVYQNDPGAWRKQLADMMAAKPDQVRDAARHWLDKGGYTLTVTPLRKGAKPSSADAAETAAGLGKASGAPELAEPAPHDWRTVQSPVDRSRGVPSVVSFPDLKFPKLQHAELDNGIPVTLAERHDIPVTQTKLLFDGGYASDKDHKLGRADFTMSLLDEGTTNLTSPQIARREKALGAIISSGCGLDTCSASVNALNDKLTPSLGLLADILRHPAFRESDVARLRGQRLADIAHEKSTPIQLALRVLPPLLYGKDNAYAMPLTGSGTAASVKALETADMQAFMHDYVRPDNVRVLVAGDTTLKQILPRLNAVFGDWKAPSEAVPKKKLAKASDPDQPTVYLIDRPGSQQSTILAGLVAPSSQAPNNLAIETMNGAFGGSFTSRLNMNLREDKHWAYGAHSVLLGTVGQRPFLIYAPVQTDKTAPSMGQILQESNAVVGDKPLTHAEIEKIRQQDVRAMPGEYQTSGAVLSAMADIAVYDRPDDYIRTRKQRTEALEDDQVQAAAEQVIRPAHLIWVIVGDLSRIEKPVRELGIGPTQVIDADGQPVRQ